MRGISYVSIKLEVPKNIFNSKLRPTRCNISWLVYFYRRSTCFRRYLRPSWEAHNCTYSFRYYQSILLLSATVEEMEFSFISSTVAASSSIGLTIPESVCTFMCSWWWTEEPPDIYKASVKINKFKNICLLLVVINNYIRTNWLMNIKIIILLSSDPKSTISLGA